MKSSLQPEVRDFQIEPPNRRVTGRGDEVVINATGGERIAEALCSRVTLSPRIDDISSPTEALMRAAVHEIAKYFPTAVISGRSRDKVKGFVLLSNVYYAGSHGMDIMVPTKPLNPCDSKNHTTTSALEKLILQGSDA